MQGIKNYFKLLRSLQASEEKRARKTANSRAKGPDSNDNNNNYNDELKWAKLGFGYIDAPRAKIARQERNRSPHPKSDTTFIYEYIRHHRVSLNNSAHELSRESERVSVIRTRIRIQHAAWEPTTAAEATFGWAQKIKHWINPENVKLQAHTHTLSFNLILLTHTHTLPGTFMEN